MKAMQAVSTDGGPTLRLASIPKPRPGQGEVLVRVEAAGVTPTELLWYPTTHTAAGGIRTLAIPGHEFSGVIEEVGDGVTDFAVGHEVFGMNDWFMEGATAEFCITKPEWIATRPTTLTAEAAATVPIGALTAWQGLLSRAKLKAGERVLVHGGSGAVGAFAIQLATRQGAEVIATASAQNAAFVTNLGATQVIDYKAARFEDAVQNADVIFDTVGGETLRRSWAVLKPGGRMITIAADAEATVEQRVKDAFFIVEPKREQLVEISRLIDAGILKTWIKVAVPLDQAATAYADTVGHGHGKTVVVVT